MNFLVWTNKYYFKMLDALALIMTLKNSFERTNASFLELRGFYLMAVTTFLRSLHAIAGDL